jgi:hypothetical protein
MIIRGIEEHDLRAVLDIPRVREWMNSHSWLVNIIVCVIFVVLILF